MLEDVMFSSEQKIKEKHTGFAQNDGAEGLFRHFVFMSSKTVRNFLVFFIVLLLSGCKTVSPVHVQSQEESDKEVKEALTAVAGAISGRPLDEKELQELEKQIRTDEKAQTAVQAITDSMGGKTPVVKYCPIDGRRYAPHMEYCPIHNVKLEVVEP